MHGDTKLIQKAYNECLDLLNVFSSKEFVVTIIQTISNLVQNSMIIAKDAVFLSFFQTFSLFCFFLCWRMTLEKL
jgi:hypothetical protein